VVHPLFRGAGVGRALLETAEAYAFDHGKKLTTSVVAHNLGAMNFYLRNGFIFKRAYVILHYSN
jgi:dTDP-4-amino-4,6-dideoxy-D-galactose acyltransferase